MTHRAMTRTYAAAVTATVLLVPGRDAQEPQFAYLSNVTGTTDGGRVLTTIGDQTTRTLEQLQHRLRQRGLDLQHVVAVNVFLKDARHFQDMNAVYRRFFATDPPTRATAEADLPDPDALIQISAVATRERKQVIAPQGMASPSLPYSWGIKAGNTLFLSGMTSRAPDTYQPVLATCPRRRAGSSATWT